jgi:hypothetical protein
MSNIDERKTSDVSAHDQKAAAGPTQYAPMPVLLPVMFLIALGLVIAYGVVSR